MYLSFAGAVAGGDGRESCSGALLLNSRRARLSGQSLSGSIGNRGRRRDSLRIERSLFQDSRVRDIYFSLADLGTEAVLEARGKRGAGSILLGGSEDEAVVLLHDVGRGRVCFRPSGESLGNAVGLRDSLCW